MGEEGKTIRLFNLDRQRFIEKAAVKHQCSGSYFYGDDDKLENAIQSMEQAYARTLRRVRAPNYNKFHPDDELVLKRFWLLQYLRTEAASKRMAEMSSNLGEIVGADQSFGLGIKEAVISGMYTFAKELKIIDDLRGCLVKNNTDIPLISSDDPAILTNRWFKADRNHRSRSFGLGSAGIIAILPVAADLVFIAYDPFVYSVPKKDGFHKVNRGIDIQSINHFQILNCRANIFPGNTYEAKSLINEFGRYCDNRLATRHILNYSVLDRIDGDRKRYQVVSSPLEVEHQEALVHSQTLFPNPKLWPSFLNWRRKGFGMVNGTGAGCIRQSRVDERGGPPYKKLHTKH